MARPDSDESEFTPFFQESQPSFKRLPERSAQGTELATRSAVFAIGAGLLDYLAALAGGATAVYNRLTRGKYCPHCKARGNCNQRVCRSCKKLFFPEAVEIAPRICS